MGEWIKCCERMPEEGEDVLVYDGLRQVHEGCYFLYGDRVVWENPSYYDEVNVTYWTPLPEPPEV